MKATWTSKFSILASSFLLAAGSGCAHSTLQDNYEKFRREPSAENLTPLDEGGREGATLLIGWLELHTAWALVESLNNSGRSIGVSTIYKFSDRPTAAPGWEYEGFRDAGLQIFNPYVLSWAESVTTVQKVRTPRR